MNTLCRSAAAIILCLGLKVASEEIIVRQGFNTIQSVLNDVKPGDVVILENGEYVEDLKTRVHGTEGERITIKGAGGSSGKGSVVIRGTGDESRVFQLMHDYYTLEDFTIDGHDDDEDNIRNILLYVAADELPTERSGGYMSALDGLVVSGMVFKHALGECVRIRNFVTYADIDNNEITDCGILDFEINDDPTEKNGEGIYLGTARNQWDDTSKNPTGEADICLGNRIRNNYIMTNGNEGVDVKEGCLETVIENNKISMQHDQNAGGISSHADYTTITGNTITDAAGAGVRVGTDEADEDGIFYGLDNTVTGNIMVNCESSGVKIMSIPQRAICGNDVELPPGQDEDTYDYSGGDHGDEFEPFEACGVTTTSSPTLNTPAPSAAPNTPAPTSTPNTTAPSATPTTPTQSPTPKTPAPSAVPNTSAPPAVPNTPAPSAMPTTASPSPTVDTPAPSSVSNTSAPTSTPNTAAPSAMPTTATASPTLNTPAPSAVPNTSAPTSMPNTPAPSAMPTTATPSPTLGTPAPSPAPNTSPPTYAPNTPAPSAVPPTPAPSVTPGTASPSDDPRDPTNPLIVRGAMYLGCGKDEKNDRTLRLAYKARNTMTNEGCIDHCRNEGFLYAGTTIGRMCRCGNYNIFEHGLSTDCNMECPQVSAMPCGGDWALTSWEILPDFEP